MTQKLVAQTDTLRGSFNETRDIGQHKTRLVAAPRLTNSHDAEIRRDGGKGVVGDPGLGSSNYREERRFSGVGVANNTNIGNQTQLEEQPAFFTRFSILRFSRGLIRRGSEMYITQASTPATRDHYTLTMLQQVCNNLFGVGIAHDSTTGDGEHNIFPFGSMHFLAGTGASCSGLEMLVVTIIDQGIQAGSRLYIHTATPAAISAIWSTERRKFFAAEVHGAIAAVTGFYIDFCMIVEHSAAFSSLPCRAVCRVRLPPGLLVCCTSRAALTGLFNQKHVLV